MTNMQKLIDSKNESEKIFGTTVESLSHSQGFYGRLMRAVNDGLDDFNKFRMEIQAQKFKNSLDVVLYLET